MRNFLRTYIASLDFLIALAMGVFLYIFLPTYLDANAASSFYNIGITVLSIVFSLFFAALAIIMSSTDNDFIEFLEEKNQFTGLMVTFKVVLAALFLSLILSIVLYTKNDFFIKNSGSQNPQEHKIWFVIFQFFFTYSLIGTALSIKDTISFTKYRTKFLASRKKKCGTSGGDAEQPK